MWPTLEKMHVEQETILRPTLRIHAGGLIQYRLGLRYLILTDWSHKEFFGISGVARFRLRGMVVKAFLGGQ